jgi:DNA-binding response OmpR family regulator
MTKILVVDDDHVLGQMLQDMLMFNGYDVVVSKKPEDTIENILQHNIDLVLLDKLISGVDGTSVVSSIRANEDTKEIPVLMMTALHNARQECIDAGASDFISKPFEMEQLFKQIDGIKAK